MNKNKFYRVLERTDRNGKKIFIVQGAESKFDVITGGWVEYTKENKTIDEAIDHMKSLYSYGLKKERVVFKGRADNLP